MKQYPEKSITDKPNTLRVRLLMHLETIMEEETINQVLTWQRVNLWIKWLQAVQNNLREIMHRQTMEKREN